MLSICKVALGQEEYYLATAATGRDHSEGLVEASGIWLGAAGERFGLTGTAEARAVRRLFAGVDPVSGDPLLADRVRRRVAGFDCTFSTPKSVSLVQAFSPDPEVREQMRLGHEAAVGASLAYLEAKAPAIRFSTPDGPRVVRGGEMLGVGFSHRLSRAGDPHLHTHVLIANLVADPTGGPWRPLDATALFLEIRTAGALYETHLRFELTQRLGVEWQPLNGRCWSDLNGLDKSTIERLSRRTIQIAAGMQAEGWQGPAARRAMAELTRPPKDTSISYEEVIEKARVLLREAGISDTRLLNICHRVSPAALAARAAGGDDRWKEETLSRLSERTVDGSFGPRDVIKARCATAQAGRSVDGVQQDARELLTDERVIGRGEHAVWLRGGATGSVPVGRLEVSFTTLDIAATEDRIAALARSMVGERPDALAVISYGAGGRFDALDALSLAAASWHLEGRSIMAVAPGRWPAAGIGSACGIDCVLWPAVRLTTPMGARDPKAPASGDELQIPQGSVVVLAEVQCYGPLALERLLRSCESAGASAVLLGPRWALESRPALREAAALAAELPAPSIEAPSPWAVTPAATSVGRRFGGVAVTVVPSLGAARDEAVRQLASARDATREGRAGGAIVVTGDEAIASALRAVPGVADGEIVHARHVKGVLASRAASGEGGGALPQLVVVGGAAVLRQGATAAPGTDRSHILVAPGIAADSPDGLGRAVEAARPRYLTSHLGVPPADLAGRAEWRAVAVTTEQFRDRWLITDVRHALGRGQPGTERSSERATELAVVERLGLDLRRAGRAGIVRERDTGLGIGR